MKKIEISAGLVLLVLFLVKVISQNKYGSEPMSYTFLGLTLAYIIGGWFFLKDFKNNINKKGLSAFAGLVLGFGILATLFKINLWVGNYFTSGVGLIIVGVLIVVLISKFIKAKEQKDNYFYYYKYLLVRSMVIFTVLLLFTLTPTRTLITLYNRDSPEYIDAFMEFNENPSKESLNKLEKQKELRDKKLSGSI